MSILPQQGVSEMGVDWVGVVVFIILIVILFFLHCWGYVRPLLIDFWDSVNKKKIT